MDSHRLHRFIAVLAGAASLYGLQQGVGLAFYFALPGAIVVYVLVLVTLTYLLGSGRAAK